MQSFKLGRGAANAKVTQGCGYSHCTLQRALCTSTAWDYNRASTETGKTWIHPVAMWFLQVFWLSVASVPNPKGALMETCHPHSKRGRILLSIAPLNYVETNHHPQPIPGKAPIDSEIYRVLY